VITETQKLWASVGLHDRVVLVIVYHDQLPQYYKVKRHSMKRIAKELTEEGNTFRVNGKDYPKGNIKEAWFTPMKKEPK
jgi:hypothetical protein